MKKLFITLILAAMTALASDGQPLELGINLGTSVNGYSQIDVGADLAYIFPLKSNLEIGLGAGLRYARPLYEIINTSVITASSSTVDTDKIYANEISIPIFGRVRYSASDKLFFQMDAGYRFALFSTEEFFPIPAFDRSGVYFEPQVGYRFDNRRSLSLGVSHQCSYLSDRIKIDHQVKDQYFGHYQKRDICRPVAFLRYTKSL